MPRRQQRGGSRPFEARQLAEEPTTLKALVGEFGVSCERQIGVCAFEKVHKSVKNRVAVMETGTHCRRCA